MLINKTSVFTHLPGAPGPSLLFLFCSFHTNTINEIGQHYPQILSASMHISILSTGYCFYMNNIPNSANKKKHV